MRLILPRAGCHILLLVGACYRTDPPVAPGPPIVADPEISVDTADKECDGMLTALETYARCPNADDGDRAWARGVIKNAQDSFEAGKKGVIDEQAQHTLAHACRHAATTIGFATQRCQAGPKPRID